MRNLVAIVAMVASCAVAGSWAQGVPGQGSWQTTLQGRDLDGDGRADAYFDTLQNVTWLDGYTTTEGFPNQPLFTGGSGGGTFYGVSGWRLPTALSSDSELQTLWRVELGGARNLGPFQNLLEYAASLPRPMDVWSSDRIRCSFSGSIFAPCTPDTNGSFETIAVFDFGTGRAYAFNDDYPSRLTTPVHGGDVGAAVGVVPEPGTYALLGLGLLAVALRRRR